MNKLLERIGEIVTGMSAVTFVLLMTIIGMVFLSHGLFVQIFSPVMEPWHASAAAWTLALGWEFTVLITTCNIKFVNRKLPLILAIGSGIIVLFFIQAFDASESSLSLIMRWFIGCIVTTINYVYSELFYTKWCEHVKEKEISLRLFELTEQHKKQTVELAFSSKNLDQAFQEIQRLQSQLLELEQFKVRETEKLTCPYCKTVCESIYKLTSHKGNCPANPIRQLNGVSHKILNQ